MAGLYNIYCDESCHLEHDQQPVMLLGAVWCPKSEVQDCNVSIRKLKASHSARGELKWTKVSTSKQSFYLDLVDLFFSNENVNFRALVVDDKSKLDHSYFSQGSHDSFYYKMYFYLLRNIISLENQYHIYLDMKDTRSQKKINTLKEVLCNTIYDFNQTIIRRIQHIRSNESELLQLTDFLLGAVSYRSRNHKGNEAKLAVIERICERSGIDLLRTTPPWEEKFNLFIFSPRGCSGG